MAIETIKTQLATIQSNITGIKRAYAQAPNSLPPADMPVMVNFTGAAALDDLGGYQQTISRTYKMRLYVAPLGSGISGEAERLCEPYFERVWQQFAARPGLENLTGVLNAQILRDSGVIVLDYAGERYIGIEFALQTMEVMEVAYAANE